MSIRTTFAVVGVTAIALTFGLAAAAGHGTTVLRGHLPSNEMFVVGGIPTLFAFTCDEQRIQRPDGSARDTAECVLDANQTPPASAAHELTGVGYQSDFSVAGTPGFAGPTITTDWHGVVTPSGHVTMVAEFPAAP